MENDQRRQDGTDESAEQRRDEMLLRLLKTPPQPRPKRERPEKSDKPEKGDAD